MHNSLNFFSGEAKYFDEDALSNIVTYLLADLNVLAANSTSYDLETKLKNSFGVYLNDIRADFDLFKPSITDYQSELDANTLAANDIYDAKATSEINIAIANFDFTDTNILIKNPIPASDLVVTKEVCENDSSRFKYIIDFAASGAAAEGSTNEMYNYCAKDVFILYSDTPLTSYVKFKIEEAMADINEEAYCSTGSYRKENNSPPCNCRATGSKGGEWGKYKPEQGYCGSPSETDGVALRAGCWKKFERCHFIPTKALGSSCSKAFASSCNLGVKYWGYKYYKDALNYSNDLMDNYGEYNITAGSPESCILANAVEFRIEMI